MNFVVFWLVSSKESRYPRYRDTNKYRGLHDTGVVKIWYRDTPKYRGYRPALRWWWRYSIEICSHLHMVSFKVRTWWDAPPILIIEMSKAVLQNISGLLILRSVAIVPDYSVALYLRRRSSEYHRNVSKISKITTHICVANRLRSLATTTDTRSSPKWWSGRSTTPHDVLNLWSHMWYLTVFELFSWLEKRFRLPVRPAALSTRIR